MVWPIPCVFVARKLEQELNHITSQEVIMNEAEEVEDSEQKAV